MKKYTRPNMEIAKFSVEDIITTSAVLGTNGAVVNADALVGANADMYAVYQQNSSADNTNVSVFTW